MPKIQITAKGIRRALQKYTAYQSLSEYIWNGFDAQASEIKIEFKADELGNIEYISLTDNGYGIPHSKLQEKFEPVFESKKAAENKLKKNQSAIHGKNGIGRLTFFSFARNASWKTTYCENESNFTYEIYANAENINLYTGINATPKKTLEQIGTTVTFSGIHNLIDVQLGQRFIDFLLKEFAWFLALNANRNFSITINSTPINYEEFVADYEEIDFTDEKTNTSFNVRYIRWNQKLNNETSKYYYIGSENKEKWKEPTVIKNKGEHFYHSVFIQSPYFDSFGFQTDGNQDSLIGGTRSDSQFKFLRKKLANVLRIKRRPFLKVFAEKLVQEYKDNKMMPDSYSEKLPIAIATIYEMQPRIFSALNREQKKIFIGLLGIALDSEVSKKVPTLLESAIDLNQDEQNELKKLFL